MQMAAGWSASAAGRRTPGGGSGADGGRLQGCQGRQALTAVAPPHPCPGLFPGGAAGRGFPALAPGTGSRRDGARRSLLPTEVVAIPLAGMRMAGSVPLRAPCRCPAPPKPSPAAAPPPPRPEAAPARSPARTDSPDPPASQADDPSPPLQPRGRYQGHGQH